jgi:DtxR family transcriptional regulator, Mn-dependent transcriptional regulator
VLQEAQPGVAVGTTRLAERLGVASASASGMFKRLVGLGLVNHAHYHGARLTEPGERLALELTRHHRLLELLLSEVLEMPWHLVHEEADRLEHGLSEELEAQISARLGNPQRDPHGSPIPSAQLVVSEQPTEGLDGLRLGASGSLVRVFGADPAMLRYLDGAGIKLGDPLQVIDREPSGGATTVRAHGQLRSIEPELAARMRIKVSAG